MKPLNLTLSVLSAAILGSALMAGVQIKAPELLPWSASMPMQNEDTNAAHNKKNEKKPLYWVAPMDANYRRDQPGQSPMGMDLVPVFANESGDDGGDDSLGTVKISPEVVNNLGVRTAVAVTQAFKQSINTVGYVRINEHEIKHVHPRVEGWVETLHVKAVGDEVVEGAPLYDIYSPELVNAQEELLIAMARKNKRLIKAASERLFALQLTKAQVDELKRAKTVKQTLTIFAPKTGVVDQINIAEGFYVKPGTSMMAIVDLSKVWVEAQVFERHAMMVNKQMNATMHLDYLPEKSWTGNVDYIYPKLDSKSRSLTVRMLVDNQDLSLKPNMFMTVTLTGDQAGNPKNHTVQIPTQALIRTGHSNRVVLALDEGKYKSIQVKIGRIADGWVEILSGVNAGEKVVTSAQFMIDSESSKTSDFKRIDTREAMHSSASMKGNAMAEMHTMEQISESVSVMATINSIDRDNLKANVNHPAISEWKWPEMKMNFQLDPSLDLSNVSAGDDAHIEITKKDKRTYVITQIHVMGGAK